MKTIINSKICRIFLFAATLGMISSCTDFLDIDPRGQLTESNMYRDVAQARMAVYGAYAQLATKNLYGDKMFDYFHMDTDECRMVSGDPKNDWRNFCLYSVSAANPEAFSLYTHLYRLINRANDPIANIPKMEIWVQEGGMDATEPSADLKTLRRLYAEAIFLRAIAYNDLINFFGDVPEKFTPSEAVDDLAYNIPRTNRDLIYDRIIKEMVDYVAWLPRANEVAAEERITQGAGRGLLARIALRAGGKHIYWDPETYDPNGVFEGTRDNQSAKLGISYLYSVSDLYEIAQQQCKKVIDQHVHALQPDYKQIWVDLLNSRIDATYYERMFEVGIFKQEEGGGYIGSYNSVPIAWNSVLPYGEAKNYVHIMPNYFAHFNDKDSRKLVTCWPVRMSSLGCIGYAGIKTDGTEDWSLFRNVTSIHLGKFRRWWITTPYKSRLNTDANWCMLRYPDVLLMYAEATLWIESGGNYNGSTSNADALEAFNKVRRRAFSQPIDSPWAGTGSFFVGDGDLTTLTFNDIMYERWFEFGGENIRKWDLFRWGKMEDRLKDSRQEIADLYFFWAKDNTADYIPAEWKSAGYVAKKFVAPYNQAFIDAAAGNRPYRYYYSKYSTATGAPPIGEEPLISFVSLPGYTQRTMINPGASEINPESTSYRTYSNDANFSNLSDKRGVARFFRNKYKSSLIPFPQNVLDMSSNTKQSPFVYMAN